MTQWSTYTIWVLLEFTDIICRNHINRLPHNNCWAICLHPRWCFGCKLSFIIDNITSIIKETTTNIEKSILNIILVVRVNDIITAPVHFLKHDREFGLKFSLYKLQTRQIHTGLRSQTTSAVITNYWRSSGNFSPVWTKLQSPSQKWFHLPVRLSTSGSVTPNGDNWIKILLI